MSMFNPTTRPLTSDLLRNVTRIKATPKGTKLKMLKRGRTNIENERNIPMSVIHLSAGTIFSLYGQTFCISKRK
jgi:hypothetical protein